MTDPERYRGYEIPLAPAQHRAMRDAAGLSQADLAAWANVTDRSVRRWDVTQYAPVEVSRFVIDRWLDVRDMARETIEAAEGAGIILLAGGTDEERAITRLVMYVLEEQGRRVTLSP